MKQHITTKQLDELSEKGKKKLRKWWKPKEEEYIAHAWDGIQDLPLLSIGQMIEFLDDERYFDEVNIIQKYPYIRRPKHGGKWSVKNTWGWDGPEGEKYQIELCDALWSACKEILDDL